MSTRLERSTTNRVVAGVCAGIGDYLEIDPTVVRVFFVIGSILTGGLGILGYIVLLVIMPLPGRPAPFVKNDTEPSTDAGATVSAVSEAPRTPSDPAAAERRRAAFGFFLIALGVIFLFGNAGIFRIVRWDLVWPLVLVAMGALLLSQRMRR